MVILHKATDRALVVVAFAQRHVTQVTDPGHLPRVHAEVVVDPAADRRHIADGAGSEMLVTLCRPVTGRVRNTDQTDVGVGGILVVLAP